MQTTDTLPSKAVCNHDGLLSKPAGSGVLGGTATCSAAAGRVNGWAGGERGFAGARGGLQAATGVF